MKPVSAALGLLLLLLLLWPGLAACSSVRVTDPPRTATEQFLLSTAAARAVGQLSYAPLRGRTVYLDTAHFAASEQAFVIGELRARLLLSGVRLVPQREDCEVVMEVRSGGVGIDRQDSLLGLSSIVLTAAADDTIGVPFATPEIAIQKNIDQFAVASVSFVAYWRDTGEIVASSGPYLGTSFRDDWWFFGFGPKTVGDIPPVEAKASQ